MYESTIKSLPLLARGKVRDIYAVGDDKLLLVTSDRLSAYDVILPTPIPQKGEILIALANFWFEKLRFIVPNQLTGIDPETVVAQNERDQVRGRAMVVKKYQVLPVEAVVRGYLEGSGWTEYQATQSVCGVKLPPGLHRASKLPQPIFTPATKAAAGEHDQNIDFATTEKIIGAARAAEVRDVAVRHPVPAVLEHPVLIATDGRMRTEEDMLAPRRSLDRVREQVEERLPSPSLLHRILRP